MRHLLTRRTIATFTAVWLVALGTIGLAQAPPWWGIQTRDDAKQPYRVVATLSTIEVTRTVGAPTPHGPTPVSCSIVSWDDVSKSFGVDPRVIEIDKKWRDWKLADGAAWENVNQGERFDFNGRKATGCRASKEGQNLSDAFLDGCYRHVVQQCVSQSSVRLLTEQDWTLIQNSIKKGQDEILRTIDDLAERVRSIEQKGQKIP